ncbi:hypothetical protein BEP19_13445 [Ammoniphilus oxalaticus]|uniref:Phosphatidylglycerol lysyltransferase n=1 Tax=Ammoniphilus oxalaticus TaxID=66863 RepID=A0A419SF37_9BACL|nr:lysylphosphatidylglycerol synthase transmembrane domain-containing protein [Ammoniphilus oxalaticus]RKD22071.1 hypothetical protein BEP19_13445 [Ammoniphilus oxalaticus]
MDTTRLKKRFGYGLAFGFLVIVGFSIWGDFRQLQDQLIQFQWGLLPLIFLCTLLGYALRFVKWELYLRTLQIRLTIRESAVVFLSGLAMTITPGKAGELLKASFLQRLKNTPFERAAPIVVAERVTDLVAMLLLAGWGLTRFSEGIWLLVLTSIVLLSGMIILQFRGLCQRLMDRLRKMLKSKGHWVDRIERFYDSSFVLFRFSTFALTSLISVISWLFECLAFHLIFSGLGLTQPFVDAVYIFSFSTIAGAVSMLPGGLGIAETSMVRLLIGIGVESGEALVATLFGRFATLWFGVFLGIVVWFGWGNRLIQKKGEERQ